MFEEIKKLIHHSINTLGFQLIRTGLIDHDIDEDKAFMNVYEKCKEFTMTSKESMYSLHKSIEYVIKAQIPGDFVECGVWKGGCMMFIALTLLELNVKDRKLYLYDTFEGMTEPSDNDFSLSGRKDKAINQWKKEISDSHNNWCYASLEEVKNNLFSTTYPQNNLVFSKGKVEETIPNTIPSNIALMRLDTDWYESTKHELIHLFPLLSNLGILIIDDYGQWAGSKKAVDEYFLHKKLFLQRIDHSVRIGVKTDF